MINDNPNSITLTKATSPSSGVAVQKSVEVKNKESVETARDSVQPDINPKVDAEKLAERVVADTEDAKQRRDEVKDRVNEAIPKVRELMNKNQRSLDFRVAEDENRIIVTVIDKETDKVIRQIPPEDLLQIASDIDDGVDSLKEGSILNFRA